MSNFVEVVFSAREKFSCGENCIPRTEMCTLKGASNCSQHYTKCGSVCVDKYYMREEMSSNSNYVNV